MPCPKCGHLLIREDGVVFCEECLHVVEREGDPRFPVKVEEDVVEKKIPTKKVGRPKRRGRPKKYVHKRKPKYKKQLAKGRICLTEKCDNPVFAKGLCKRCYGRRWYRNKKDTKSSNHYEHCFVFRSCTVFGCEKMHFARGYCRKHYSSHVERYPHHSRPADPKERKCTLCPRLHYAKGLCKIHYSKFYDFDTKWQHLLD